MGELKRLRGGTPLLGPASVKKIHSLISGNGEETAEMLRKIYYATNDMVQMLLIEEIARMKGIILMEEEDPLRVA